MRIVPIGEIASTDLLAHDEVAPALAMALEELAIAHALVLLIGEKRGVERYISVGGHVRFNDEGEPVLVLPDKSIAT